MPFDGVTISHLVRELNQELTGQRIDKIYQPERDELTLVIKGKKGGSRLTISANARWSRMYISQERKENPARPYSFCMLLRKHLEGSKILGFDQVGFDRIVVLRLEALNDLLEWQEKFLICEFTGKNSNIVLIDPQTNLILDGIKRYDHEVSRHREVQPGLPYIPPPTQDKLDPTDTDYARFCETVWETKNSLTISNALFQTFSGLSPATSREICIKSGVDHDLPVAECGEYELSRVFETTRSLSTGSLGEAPTILIGKDGPVDYFAFTPPVSDQEVDRIVLDSLNQAMDFFYTAKMTRNRLDSLKTNLLRNLKTHLDKAYKKLFFQEGDLFQAHENEIYRVWGELLTAYAFQVKKGETSVSLPNFDGEGETEIELVPYLGAVENAQKYFKQYAKSRKARERLVDFIEENRKEIAYLESVVLALEKSETVEETEDIIDELEEQHYMKHKSSRGKSKQIRSQPRRFHSSAGMDIYVGKNNRQNDLLTLKKSGKNDLWLHTQGFAGTHVIVDLPQSIKGIEDVPDEVLEEAALLAAYYSRAKEAEKVAVDYTFRSNVRKPRGSRPGMVIYDNYWTINVNPADARLERLLATLESSS
ncbi:MAG: NFACT family protein [Ignavibacteriales bacterium]